MLQLDCILSRIVGGRRFIYSLMKEYLDSEDDMVWTQKNRVFSTGLYISYKKLNQMIL